MIYGSTAQTNAINILYTLTELSTTSVLWLMLSGDFKISSDIK